MNEKLKIKEGKEKIKQEKSRIFIIDYEDYLNNKTELLWKKNIINLLNNKIIDYDRYLNDNYCSFYCDSLEKMELLKNKISREFEKNVLKLLNLELKFYIGSKTKYKIHDYKIMKLGINRYQNLYSSHVNTKLIDRNNYLVVEIKKINLFKIIENLFNEREQYDEIYRDYIVYKVLKTDIKNELKRHNKILKNVKNWQYDYKREKMTYNIEYCENLNYDLLISDKTSLFKVDNS